MTTLPTGRTLLVWLLLMAVETAHGILRNLFLTPVVGDFRARQMGVFIGSGLILVVTYLTIRWMLGGTMGGLSHGLAEIPLIRIGVWWTVLTVGFEFGLGRAIGRPWTDMLADYDFAHGGLMPFGLVALLCAPWIAARLRASRG